MKLSEYYEKYGSRITQQSERLFVDEFLYPFLHEKIERVIPQYPFLDRTGHSRRRPGARIEAAAVLSLVSASTSTLL